MENSNDATLRCSDGYTLIETLVAMMILAVSLVVILQLFSGSLKSGKLSDKYTRAIYHGREKIEEILLAETLADGDFEGDFEDGYKWRSEILHIESDEEEKPPLPFDIFSIKVVISWMEGYSDKHFEISTLRNAYKKAKDEI